MTFTIENFGKLLITIGIVFTLAGVLLLLTGKLPWIGRLPGDILIEKKNFTFYFPLATSILLSIILTLLMWLINRK